MPEEKTKHNEKILLIASYEKLEGTKCLAPYVDCFVSDSSIIEAPIRFKMRVDTGADLTMIPVDRCAELEPLERGKRLLCRLGGHRVRRFTMKKVTIHILTDTEVLKCRPSEGVMTCETDYGYLGMDVLQHLDVRLYDNNVYLYSKGGGK